MQLLDLGFDHWFAQHAPALQDNEERLARVCAVDRGSYRLRNETGEVPAELSGRFSHRIDRGIDLPCVGDWVGAQYYDNDKAAIIHETLPRRTFLRRKTPGRSTDHQMIAANIDTAFLVQSCHFDFNLNRLERYLLMAADGQVNPVILLTKTDLVSPQEMEQKRAAISAVTSAAIIALSSVDGSGFDELGTLLEPGRTCCLLGSSGVGKTTIINRLLGQNRHAVQTVSKTGEGTHTTTRRHLIVLDQGGNRHRHPRHARTGPCRHRQRSGCRLGGTGGAGRRLPIRRLHPQTRTWLRRPGRPGSRRPAPRTVRQLHQTQKRIGIQRDVVTGQTPERQGLWPPRQVRHQTGQGLKGSASARTITAEAVVRSKPRLPASRRASTDRHGKPAPATF